LEERQRKASFFQWITLRSIIVEPTKHWLYYNA